MDLVDIAAVFSALVALGALVVAYISYQNGKRIVRRQTLADLLTEYRSLEMGLAIQRLWDFYKIKCNCNKKRLIEEYKREYKKSEKESEEVKLSIEQIGNSLHYQRRIVFNFYQHLALLHFNGALDKKLVYEIWPNNALKIIHEILVPIETKAMPELIGEKEQFSETIKYMLDLYKESKSYVPKRMRQSFLSKLRKVFN